MPRPSRVCILKRTKSGKLYCKKQTKSTKRTRTKRTKKTTSTKRTAYAKKTIYKRVAPRKKIFNRELELNNIRDAADRYRRCVLEVSAKSGKKVNPYAVCSSSVFGTKENPKEPRPRGRIYVIAPQLKKFTLDDIKAVAKVVAITPIGATKAAYINALENAVRNKIIPYEKLSRAMVPYLHKYK